MKSKVKMIRVDGLGQPYKLDRLYFVEDTRGIVGNYMSFWCPEDKGYTTQIDDAGQYTGERVMNMRYTDVGWSVEFVLANVIRHVRRDQLRSAASR